MDTHRTLGDLRRNSENDELSDVRNAKIAREESVTGATFDDAEIQSVETMGDAAGRCHMCSRRVEIREDIAKTLKGVEKLDHILGHEQKHREGVRLEGEAELETVEEFGGSPVSAYAGRVEAMMKISNRVGRECARELSRKENAKELLAEAYIERAIEEALGQNSAQAWTVEVRRRIRKVYQEAEELIRKAA